VAVLAGSDYLATASLAPDDRVVVHVWHVTADGRVLGSASFTNLHLVRNMCFADHGARHRDQLALYVADLNKNVRVFGIRCGTLDSGAIEETSTFRVAVELSDTPAFDMRDTPTALVLTDPSLAGYNLDALLAIDDAVYGVTYHSRASRHTVAALDGRVVMISAVTSAPPVSAEGLLMVLVESPNMLYLLDRDTGGVISELVLPISEREFQIQDRSECRYARAKPTCFRHLPLSSLVAVGWADGRVDLMHLAERRRQHVLLTESRRPIACLTWFPVGAATPAPEARRGFREPICVVAGGQDGGVRVWMVHAHGSGLLASIPAHQSPVVMIKPRYPVGDLPFCLVSLAKDGEVRSWELADNGALDHWRLHGYVHVGARRRVVCAEMVSAQAMVLGLEEGAVELWGVPNKHHDPDATPPYDHR
jgi:WD40 repeat protein